VSSDKKSGAPDAALRKGRIVQPETGWSTGQRALLRFLEQQGVLAAEPLAPAVGRPTNADLFAAVAAAIDQQGLVDLVSQALKIGAVDLGDFTPMPDLVALIPVDVARRGEVVPIAQHDGTLEVAAANPLDLETVKSVEFTTGLRVRTKIARRADVCRAVCDAYGVPPAADRPEAAVAPEAVVDAGPEESAAWEPVEDPTEPWVVVDDDAVAAAERPVPSTDDDAPELPYDDVRDLGLFDDVRLDDPGALDDIEDDERRARPDAPASAAPDLDVGAAAPAVLDRPAVVVVSRDLWRRVAIREALETRADAPCVLTMRDEVEARAALALGRVGAVVVEGGALAGDGRPLWEALRSSAIGLVVWGGRPAATDVVGLDRDTNADEVAAHVRALLGEAVDD